MTASGSKANGTSGKPIKLVGAAVVFVAVVATVIWLKAVRGSEDPTATMATFVARRGPLTISVLESGAIKAKDQEVVRNEVEGRTTIVSIIPEGSRVQKGDLLVELDVSELTDSRIDQEILVQNAEAAWVNAKESLDIARSQAQSNIDKAELDLRFAQLDLEKYNDPNGEYRNLLAQAKNDITLSEEELKRAEETLKWSQTLYDEKYLSLTEKQADELTRNRTRVKVEVAKNALEVLSKFTHKKQLDQYTSNVKQMDMELERTKAKARASIVQAEAELKAKEAELNRQQTKLKKLETQLAKARILSPADGMVVYATSARGMGFHDDRKPLADGVEVWERQELIYIPKSSSSVAEVDVHEASLDKVHPGLPAVVMVDALPGKKFIGTINRIAPLPNAQNMWMNPDLKVYTTDIDLESSDPDLRSGMSCKAEIIVEQYADVVYIPVQAVLLVEGQPTTFVVKEGLVEDRKIQIGLDNNSMIAIFGGLSEGEVVLMTPPLKAAAMEPGERIPGGGDANDATTRRINEKLKASNGQVGAIPGRTSQMPAGISGQQGAPGAGQGMQMPSAEQMQRFQNATPQERQKMIEERMKNMTPEQRQQMMQMQQGRGDQGGDGDSEEGDAGQGGRRGQPGGQSQEDKGA